MSILMYKQRHKHPNYRKTPKCNYAHIGYIATRPGASKNEGMQHGLFGKLSPSDEVTEFQSWQKVGRLVRELSYRRVNIFRGIISFLPETAAELHLSDHKAWEEYIEQHLRILAQKNGIRPQDLQWAAAHHNEQSHPHLHVVFWDKNQKTMIPYVSPKIPDSIRIALIKETFPEKIQAFLAAKDKARTELSEITDKAAADFEAFVKELKPKEYRRLREAIFNTGDEEISRPSFDGVIGQADLTAFIPYLFTLKDKMPKTGRLLYRLLPEKVKAELDSFVILLKEKNEYIRQLTEDYADSKCRLAMLYHNDPENVAEIRKRAIAEVDKLIANKVLKAIKVLLNKDRELASYEYSQAQKEYYAEEMLCEILMMLEQVVMELDDEYEGREKAMSTDLSKSAKKEWYLKHKDKGMEI